MEIDKLNSEEGRAALVRTIGVLVGAFLLFAISFSLTQFFIADNDSTLGEMTNDCRIAMTQQGVADKGGCLCIAQAAIQREKLPRQRIELLQDYFRELSVRTDAPMNRAPTSMQLSRKIGLVYGHPFLRAYSQCAATSFEPIEADIE